MDKTSRAIARFRNLSTPRLHLRRYTPGDVDALHAIWIDPDVRRYLWDEQVIPRSTALEVVQAALESASTLDFGQWMLTTHRDEPVGFCGFRPFEPRDDEAELIYGLLPCWWKRGLAVEAATAALDWAFDERGLSRVVAATDPPNAASVRVMERLGMRFWKRDLFHGLETVFYVLDRRSIGRHDDRS